MIAESVESRPNVIELSEFCPRKTEYVLKRVQNEAFFSGSLMLLQGVSRKFGVCCSVERLTISCSQVDDSLVVLSSLSQLRELALIDCFGTDVCRVSGRCLSAPLTLEVLVLLRCKFSTSVYCNLLNLTNPSALRACFFSDDVYSIHYNFPSEPLRAFLASCHRIEHISISGLQVSQSLNFSLPACGLQTLLLGSTSLLGASLIRSALFRMKVAQNIRVCDLKGLGKVIGRDLFTRFWSIMPLLSWLRFTHCAGLQDEDVKQLLENGVHLTHLCLDHCEGVAYISSTSNLQHLSVKGCRGALEVFCGHAKKCLTLYVSRNMQRNHRPKSNRLIVPETVPFPPPPSLTSFKKRVMGKCL